MTAQKGGGAEVTGDRPRAHATFAANGLPRARRIRRRREFLSIQGHPEARVRAAHFLVLVAWREGDGTTRLGIVASRKVGVAVVRTRAKRLIRELFRRRWEALPKGADLVVIVRPGLVDQTYEELGRELDGILPALHRAAGRRGQNHALHQGGGGPKVGSS